jgi:pimeloyl-ACP methyl ester carboxylesterase
MPEASWTHSFSHANGIRLHYVEAGEGFPVVMLHGWPEYWRVWRKNIDALAAAHRVIALDLRGFGETDKPPGDALAAYTLEHHVADLAGLADALALGRFVIVAHDIGAYVAQAFARAHVERVAGLFFFDCPYPGIGRRWVDAAHVREIWYQSFHQQPFAAALLGSSRDACKMYFAHQLAHWSHDPHAFDEDLEAWVDNFMRPGNLQGGFNWYIASHAARMALIRDGAPEQPPIEVPTCVRWGAQDPILLAAWADRLGEYFSDLDFDLLPDAGHFAAYEQAERANAAMLDFLARITSRA